MTAVDALVEAARVGLVLETDGDGLCVSAPEAVLDAWRERLLAMKPAIMPVLWRLEGMRRHPDPIPTARDKRAAPGGPGQCFSCGDRLDAPPEAVGRCVLCQQAAELFYQARPDTNDRRTPRWFFELCEQRYGPFGLDAAASPANHLCARYFTEVDNALTIARWCADQVFCNPPYGPGGTIEQWIAKGREQRDKYDVRTLLLLPADTSTRWYHDVSTTELIELVPFRLKFDGPAGVQRNTAKFGSVLVWIAPKIQKPKIQKPKSLFDGAPIDDPARPFGNRNGP